MKLNQIDTKKITSFFKMIFFSYAIFCIFILMFKHWNQPIQTHNSSNQKCDRSLLVNIGKDGEIKNALVKNVDNHYLKYCDSKEYENIIFSCFSIEKDGKKEQIIPNKLKKSGENEIILTGKDESLGIKYKKVITMNKDTYFVEVVDTITSKENITVDHITQINDMSENMSGKLHFVSEGFCLSEKNKKTQIKRKINKNLVATNPEFTGFASVNMCKLVQTDAGDKIFTDTNIKDKSKINKVVITKNLRDNKVYEVKRLIFIGPRSPLLTNSGLPGYEKLFNFGLFARTVYKAADKISDFTGLEFIMILFIILIAIMFSLSTDTIKKAMKDLEIKQGQTINKNHQRGLKKLVFAFFIIFFLMPSFFFTFFKIIYFIQKKFLWLSKPFQEDQTSLLSVGGLIDINKINNKYLKTVFLFCDPIKLLTSMFVVNMLFSDATPMQTEEAKKPATNSNIFIIIRIIIAYQIIFLQYSAVFYTFSLLFGLSFKLVNKMLEKK